MRRTMLVLALVALLSAPALFAADISVGVDVPLGMTYWKDSAATDSVNGFLYGFEGVVNAMFTPQVAGEFKLGLVFDSYSQSDIFFVGDKWESVDRYLNFVGLFKFYVTPTAFIGAGLEYSYFLGGHTEETAYSLGSADVTRSDLSPEDFMDAGFLLAAGGVDVIVSPTLVVPLAINLAYGVINMPTDVTRMHFYGTIGLRFLL